MNKESFNSSTEPEQGNKKVEEPIRIGVTSILAITIFFLVLLTMAFISISTTVDPSNTLSP